MFRNDHSSAAVALPTPAAAGTEGYYTPGDPLSMVPATVVTADHLNILTEELCSVVDAAGIAHSKVDMTQVRDAIYRLISLGSYVATTGSDLTIVGTVPGSPALTNGFWVVARFPNINTVDAPKLNLNGLGAKKIYLKDFTTELPKGRLPIEGLLSFHTGLDGWVLLTEAAAGGYGDDTNASANATTVQQPGIRAYFRGLRIQWKQKTTNTGSCTLNVTALGAKTIKYQGANLTAGQLVANRMYEAVYDEVADVFHLISNPG